ncbi:MAG: class I SAM-dependent methyltransferase [Rhodospirillales bacterium]
MAGFFKNLLGQAFPPASPPTDDPVPPPSGSAEETVRNAFDMLNPVAAAYRRRLGQCGPTAKGAFWANQANVRHRFELLCRVFDPADVARGGVTVRDFGCGYGALFDYLANHPILNDGHYVGYDITRSMLDACEQRIRDPRASFRCSARPTAPADYTLVSGTFNLKLQADEQAWHDYVEASLTILWETTRKAMAFNMLDRRRFDPDMEGLYYADCAEIAAFCRSALSPDVEVIENYELPDFTILVRRRSASA